MLNIEAIVWNMPIKVQPPKPLFKAANNFIISQYMVWVHLLLASKKLININIQLLSSKNG